jgi:hypothetical protein
VTQLWQPITTLHIGPMSKLDAIINLFKVFWTTEKSFFLVNLQLCTVLVIHTLDFFTQIKVYFSIQNWIWKFWSSGWLVLCL